MAQGEAAPEDDGKRSSTRQWQWQRYTSYLRRPSCLSSPAADGPTGVGSDRSAAAAVRDSGSAAEQRAPAHLVVMVNGIIGRSASVGTERDPALCAILALVMQSNLSVFFCSSYFRRNTTDAQLVIHPSLLKYVFFCVCSAANWKYAAKQFVKSHPEDVVVHRSQCNYSTLTFDGVDVMGERLADEVISIVANNPGLQKISFVGHSLGGLIARYAITLLYEKSIQKHSSEENGECEDNTPGTTCVDKNFKGKIAGLEPINFITFATPHLGSRLHKQIPILRGFYTLEKMAYHTCWIFGRTGKHLFLKDKDNGKPPLLVQMVNDYGDLRFMSALQSFKRRVAYSNVCFDFIVGRKTSSIRHQHELPKRQDFMKNSEYRHIVYVKKPIITDVPQMNFSASMTCELNTISEMEEVMINGLNRVPWERVDVSFRKCSQRFFAHSTMQVCYRHS
ncbi:unnamed protein product [Musa textilis]